MFRTKVWEIKENWSSRWKICRGCMLKEKG